MEISFAVGGQFLSLATLTLLLLTPRIISAQLGAIHNDARLNKHYSY